MKSEHAFHVTEIDNNRQQCDGDEQKPGHIKKVP